MIFSLTYCYTTNSNNRGWEVLQTEAISTISNHVVIMLNHIEFVKVRDWLKIQWNDFNLAIS